ncbi:anti-repressor SinI family protein [Oceanobacillus halotolerans]|nr:anti-repressor SinI family protein [Oceanobacillus halotolerans]
MEKMKESKKLDNEWVSLMKEAKTIGLKKEDIRTFLTEAKKKKKIF